MMKSKKLFLVFVLTLITIMSFCIILNGCDNKDSNDEVETQSNALNDNRIYKIHFLNVTNSDAILIESDGKFGMIDCAEDTDNPRGLPNLNLEGHEKEVVEYVKRIAGDKDGKVTLDFVLGTHAHSDHLGGFDTLISDPDIFVKRAYLKRYFPDNITKHERNRWDNQEVYDQMIDAIKNEDGCVLVQDNLDHLDLTKDIGWGKDDFQMTIFNGKEDHDLNKSLGENANSICVLFEKFGKTAFLTGDLDNLEKDMVNKGDLGDEDRMVIELKEFGVEHIDVLKAGHHGHIGSNNPEYLRALSPTMFIVPNLQSALYPTARATLKELGTPIYGAIDYKGIIVQFTPKEIILFDGENNIIKEK